VGSLTYERSRPLVDLIARNVAPLNDRLRRDADGQEALAPGEKEKIEEEILRRKNWLNEFFADMFATYVLGYAYAAYALLLRFDLAGLYRNQGITHPPLVDRADAILFMLKTIERELAENRDERARIAFRRESLSRAWSGVLAMLGPAPATGSFEFDRGELAAGVAIVAGDARFYSERAEHETRSVIRGNRPEQVPILARDLLYAAWISLEDGDNPSGSYDPVEIGYKALQAWRTYCKSPPKD
jgi:hypothetical protein